MDSIYADFLTEEEILFDKICDRMSSNGKLDAIGTYGKGIKNLSGKWEVCHLKAYGDFVITGYGTINPKQQKSQYERNRNKFDAVLKKHGFRNGIENFQREPTNNGVARETVAQYFLALASYQDDISLLQCFCEFLQYCYANDFPVTAIQEKAHKSNADYSDVFGNIIHDIRQHLTAIHHHESSSCDTGNEDIKRNSFDHKNSNFSSQKAGKDNKNKKIDSISPAIKLEIPSRRENNPNYFGSKIIDILGRSKEQERLREFLKPDKNRRFLWFQLAGVAGQGKSRLALELALEAERQGWIAGFVPTKEEKLKGIVDQLKQWVPDESHLFIVDYVVGRNTDCLQSFFQALLDKRKEFQQDIRLLLLERQPWNRVFQRADDPKHNSAELFSSVSPSHAQWFLDLIGSDDPYNRDVADARFDSGVLELKKLEAEVLLDIVKLVGKEISKGKFDEGINLPEAEIKQQLEHIDKEGRPLYAHFLAQELTHRSNTQGWSRDDLLTAALTREQRKWWCVAFEGEPPGTEDDIPAMRLALLATMTDGIDCQEAHSRHLIPFAEKNIRQRALALTGGLLDEVGIDGPSENISAMKPDLLGEWFVILCFRKGRIPMEELTRIAWQYAPAKMSSFMQRLCQDFWSNFVVTSMLNCIDFERADPTILSEISNALVLYFVENKRSIPETVIAALKVDAEYKLKSMTNLGYCYSSGLGVEQDHQKAFALFQEAALKGYVGAMYNLSVCYAKGRGTAPNQELSFFWSERAAHLGFGGAMLRLGVCYLQGIGGLQDVEKSFSWFRKAADVGELDAMCNLGICYRDGCGIEQNYQLAFTWFQTAAIRNHVDAMFHLGVCYLKGQGIKQSYSNALTWFQRAADNNNVLAIYNLGKCYQNGIGAERNYQQAAIWYQKAANAGHLDAMFELALCYGSGRGLEQDDQQAVVWYQRAAELNHVDAMVGLGVHYIDGSRVDQSKAIAWFEKAAASESVQAMAFLGDCYDQSLGVERNNKRAALWYQKAADLGHVNAMFKLALCYGSGNGVEQDDQQAFIWYQKAANADHIDALLMLGIMYAEGTSYVEQNYQLAVACLQKSAGLGSVEAMFSLGICYLNGHGVDENYQEALEWCQRAADKGYSRAIALLESIKT